MAGSREGCREQALTTRPPSAEEGRVFPSVPSLGRGVTLGEGKSEEGCFPSSRNEWSLCVGPGERSAPAGRCCCLNVSFLHSPPVEA